MGIAAIDIGVVGSASEPLLRTGEPADMIVLVADCGVLWLDLAALLRGSKWYSG